MGRLHQEDIRKKIQVAQLLKVLTDHALNAKPDLSPTRIKAIELLLRKAMPDLSSVEMTGADGGALTVQLVRFSDPTPGKS